MADKLNRNMNLDWQLGASSSALPKVSAETALGISSRMATNTSDIYTTNITNNSNNDNGFKELANAVREFTEKPLVTNVNGRKMSDELGPTNDATQIQRTIFSGWGLEIQ